MEDITIPESYYCPITHELMVDPVIDPEGNTYERSAIVEWLKKNPTSPFTKNPLFVSDLHPNRALRDSIDLVRKQVIVKKKKKKRTTREKKNRSNCNSKETIEVKPDNIVNSIETASGVKLTTEIDSNGLLLITALPPKDGDRVPCDICCVIDISGSMGAEATLKSVDGDVESHGLSILDIVKHAVKTIIEVMGPNDRLSIVTFSDTAEVNLKLTQMTKDGKTTANKTLDKLHPTNSTNLWGGLNAGLDVLKAEKLPNRLAVLFLLTDGEPNIHPPRGELGMLQHYKSKNGLPGSVSTFGFGYKLNSVLLDQLSVEGNGTYAFIPDSSLTGTVFVNALSNTLSTFATDLLITVESRKNNSNWGKVVGNFPKTTVTNKTVVNLGSFKYGQRKDLVISLEKNRPPKSITLEYIRTSTGQREDCKLSGYNMMDSPSPLIHNYRLRLTELFENINAPPTKEKVQSFANEIESSAVSSDPFIKDLVKDINGQILEGLVPDAFARWGRHFIPSLCRAHLLQQCNNFKDPGVQHYGGDLFKTVRDTCDEIFVKLPPPKPSKVKVTYTPSQSPTTKKKSPSKVKAQTYTAPVDMSSYYNVGGGCIWSEGDVLMHDQSIKKIKEIRKGDYIQTHEGLSAKVLCVTKSTLNPIKSPLVQLQTGLILTAWHPVLINDQWKFPCQIGQRWETSQNSQVVYNFVLENGHVMMVNNVPCVTLAHGFLGDIVQHDYFGTEEVIKDLQTLPGWESGFIDMDHVTTRRDTSGLVSGYMVN
jgi:hypothetical protein